MLRKKLAFTLVELIIVVTIITLLSGIVVFAIQAPSIFMSARNSIRSNDLQTLKLAVEKYLTETQATETLRSLSDLTGYSTLLSNTNSATPSGNCDSTNNIPNVSSVTQSFSLDTTGSNFIDLSTLINKGYLTKVIKDPSGTDYQACIDGNNNALVIFAPNTENSTSNLYSYVGPSKPFSPTDIPNFKQWFKTDNLNLANNANLTSWLDSSGSNFSVTSVSTKPPVFKTNVQNGNPGIFFTTSKNQWFKTTAPIELLTDDFSIVIAASPTVGGWDWKTFVGSKSFRLETNNFQNSQLTRTGLDYAVIGGPSIISLTLSGTTLNMYLNGNSLGTNPSQNRGTTTTTSKFSYGADISGIGNADAYDGYLFEILVYKQALNTPQRLRIENYLNQKFALY